MTADSIAISKFSAVIDRRYSWAAFQRAEHSLRRQRNLPEAHSGCVENGIGYCCRHWHDGRLARAQRFHFRSIDQDNFNCRDVLESKNRVGLPVQALHTGGVELNFLQQRSAHSLNDVPINLIFYSIG